MGYEAAFFDLDDTLYPYPPCNEAGKRAAFETFRDLGYDLDREAFDALYATARRETKRELRGTAASHERFLYFKRALRVHADVHDAADALAIGGAYWDRYVERIEPFAGVEETLRALREAGLTVVVVTNLTTRIQLEKLARLGVDDLVDRVVTSEEVGREKPSAIAFTTPLAALDLRPSEAFMVGDDVEADVVGANAVGMDTVLFNADPDRDLTGPERPDHRIDAFADVTEVAL
ncbi:HAD-IA family hydrolase [Halorubrum sp. JWXQ-INN 858]|uniref:HAD family hydrolase n=1 Tax=Halorubrum sp. JWXQ-INN 858 TaxID=2690782 RepID=UPI0013586A41|nr:HAD family hydrolase [Halorubrum sp. JWXQ-INN 858]MWV64687.1 HAD-IA family hydrolase [Halorubrum sp. JWXQ-INN 858]